MTRILAARRHVAALLDSVKAMPASKWPKDDRVDWMLFRAQLEGADFFGRTLQPEESDPQVYLNEAANGVFSLLKKEYAPHRTRALAATARLESVPGLLTLARANLTTPVRLFAKLAIASARGGDDLYTTSLMTLADSLSGPERARLVTARDAALRAIHDFADWLDQRQGRMPDWKPIGAPRYNYLLHHVLLLPYTSSHVA